MIHYLTSITQSNSLIDTFIKDHNLKPEQIERNESGVSLFDLPKPDINPINCGYDIDDNNKIHFYTWGTSLLNISFTQLINSNGISLDIF
jgi:hypothetical protein